VKASPRRKRCRSGSFRPISGWRKMPDWRLGLSIADYQLLAQPFYFASMVLLAAAVSLRFFRFGGITKMFLGGLAGGFFLFILAKITGDMSKADLMPPLAAATLPALFGGVTGLVTLMYQEDG